MTDGVVYFGDEDGIFHAITAADGKKKWTFQTDAEVISSATVVGDRVLFGSYDAQLYCLNRAGKVRWKVLTEGRVHASPAVVGNHTFVAGCDAHLRVIDIRKGEELRAVDMGAYCIATPAVAGDHCYLGTFGEEIVGVDWQKGAQLWTYAHEARHFPFYGSAAITADLVVVGGRDKLVHALDRKTGQRRWEFATKGRIEGSPVIAGERVYIGSMDGTFYVLDLRSGEKVQSQTLGAPITASPAVAAGRLVIGTEDGVLYCFAGK